MKINLLVALFCLSHATLNCGGEPLKSVQCLASENFFIVRDPKCLWFGPFVCSARTAANIPKYLILESEYQENLKRQQEQRELERLELERRKALGLKRK